MKFGIILLFVTLSIFAFGNQISPSNDHSQKFKKGELSSEVIELKDLVIHKKHPKYKLLKNKVKKSFNKIEETQYNQNIINNLREVDGSGNLIGPIDIFSSESGSPNALRFKFTTNNEDFSVKEVHYQFFSAGEDISEANEMQLAELYVEGEFQYLKVDISKLQKGNYQVVLRVHTQKIHKDGYVDKHIRYAVADFEKIHVDSAHAVLEKIYEAPGSYQVGFSIANSYSDFGGEIVSFRLQTFENGNTILDDELEIASFGTEFYLIFQELADYEVKITVKDSLGDTDEAMLEIRPTMTVPKVNYSFNQDIAEPDRVRVDLSESTNADGSGIRQYYVVIVQDGVFVDTIWSERPIINYAIPVRGEFEFRVYAESGNGVFGYDVLPINYLDPAVPKSVNLMHTGVYVNENEPWGASLRLRPNIPYEEIDRVEHTLTSESGEVRSIVIPNEYLYYQPNGEMFPYVTVSSTGTWTIESTMYAVDGRVSNTTSWTQAFDYDLGTASFEMAIEQVNERSMKSFLLYPINTNPGNYGYYENFYCSAVNVETGEVPEFLDNVEVWTGYKREIYIDAFGTYEIKCSGQTNSGLKPEVTLTYEINNYPPVISNIEIQERDYRDRWYSFYVFFDDQDGWVEETAISIITPSGNKETYYTWDFLDYNFYEAGEWTIEAVSYDDQGEASEVFSKTFTVINEPPVISSISLSFPELDSPRSVRVDGDFSDDGYINEYYFIVHYPDGTITEEPSWTWY